MPKSKHRKNHYKKKKHSSRNPKDSFSRLKKHEKLTRLDKTHYGNKEEIFNSLDILNHKEMFNNF